VLERADDDDRPVRSAERCAARRGAEEERRYAFSAVFDPIGDSHEIGVSKSDPRAFSVALEAMGAEPAEVLLLDDRPENVAAARALGIGAHLHEEDGATLAVIHRAVRTRGTFGGAG
jgi:FMN phosphatase YigB (HAD superfamily)